MLPDIASNNTLTHLHFLHENTQQYWERKMLKHTVSFWYETNNMCEDIHKIT